MQRAPHTQLLCRIRWQDGCKSKRLWLKFVSNSSQYCDHRSEKPKALQGTTAGDGVRCTESPKPKPNPNPNTNLGWKKGEELAAAAAAAITNPRSLGPNISSWNKALARNVKDKEYEKAIELFQRMQRQGLKPDKFTLVPVLNACSNLRALDLGRRIHSQIIESGHGPDVYVESCLVNMYAKCGSIEDAWDVFQKMPSRDVVSWNTMLMGYVKCGQGQKALDLFQKMKEENATVGNLTPTRVTFLGLLNACASVGALEEGRRIHEQIMHSGSEQQDIFVSNALVDMYTKCGSIEDAWRVFESMPKRDVVSWNSMIGGCVRLGFSEDALELFKAMQRGHRVEPTPVTFVSVLNACASVLDLEEGRRVHEQIRRRRGHEDNVFVSSSLVDMYAKCGNIGDALMVFNKMPVRNVVSWTAMILGYVKCGMAQKALEAFREMGKEGVQPNVVTFLGVLNACAGVAALEEGRRVHQQIIDRGFESEVYVGGCLVDMYAKCGSLEDASRVFQQMPVQDVVSWTAMLGGYAMHGHAKEALEHFQRMWVDYGQVNSVTFMALLTACSHGGQVDEGLNFFQSMGSHYNVPTTDEHRSCVVDLLGRAGRLHEAVDVINSMEVSSVEARGSAWMSLLAACRIHGNVQMAEAAAKRVIELRPQQAAGYVLLSNIYAAAGKWETSTSVKRERLEKGVKKEPGRAWIEVNNRVHSFVADDDAHPQIAEIHEQLDRLSLQLKDAGYVPDTSFVLHDVEEEEKLSQLGRHSEKLAIAYGLLSTPSGAPLLVYKNLRVCGDCHTVAKLIAKIAGRTIIMRDANRFHHFQDGICSCRDYW